MNKKVCLLACIGVFCLISGILLVLFDNSSKTEIATIKRIQTQSGAVPQSSHEELPKKTVTLNKQRKSSDSMVDLLVYAYKSDEDWEAIDAELDLEEEWAGVEASQRVAAKRASLLKDDSIGDFIPGDLIQEIKANGMAQELNGQTLGILEDLKEQGFDCEQILLDLYKGDWPVQHRTVMIQALQELGSDQAQETLIKIAKEPGRTASTLGPRAVRALTALTDDASMISQCLESSIPETRDATAQELSGKELTPIAVSRLAELLKSDSWVSHNLVCAAFMTDTSIQMAGEKTRLIVNAIPEVYDVVALSQLIQSPWNSHEATLERYLFALSHIEGGRTPLRSCLVSSHSLARQIVVLGLANRGDSYMRNEVIKIIKESDEGIVRAMAVSSLGIIGVPGDIQLLEQIESQDPFKRAYQGHDDPSVVDHYPVREAAKQAIESIDNGLR